MQGVETIPRAGQGMEGYSFSLVQLPLREPDKGEQEPDQLVQGGAQPGAHQPQAHGVAQQPAGAGPDEGDADKGHQGGELGIPAPRRQPNCTTCSICMNSTTLRMRMIMAP